MPQNKKSEEESEMKIVAFDGRYFGVLDQKTGVVTPCYRLDANDEMVKTKTVPMGIPISHLEGCDAVDGVMTLMEFSEKYFHQLL